MHLCQNTEHIDSVSAFSVTVKPHVIERFTSFLTGKAGSKPQNVVEKAQFQTQADTNTDTIFLLSLLPVRRWTHSQCLFGTKQSIGHWGHFFSQPTPAWFTETKHARIVTWTALALSETGLRRDAIYLTPTRKLWVRFPWNLKYLFLGRSLVFHCCFFPCKTITFLFIYFLSHFILKVILKQQTQLFIWAADCLFSYNGLWCLIKKWTICGQVTKKSPCIMTCERLSQTFYLVEICHLLVLVMKMTFLAGC